MKHYILIFLPIIFLLTGCNTKSSVINTDPIINTGVISNINHIYTGGELKGFLSINGLINTIIFSGYYVIYKDLFSIKIPKKLTQRSYDNSSIQGFNYENIGFSEKTNIKYFNIALENTLPKESSVNQKEICLKYIYYNGSPTSFKETIVKNINNKSIFISHLTFFTEGNKNPYSYVTHLCFVNNNNIYNLTLDGYYFSEANTIINSFKFLN